MRKDRRPFRRRLGDRIPLLFAILLLALLSLVFLLPGDLIQHVTHEDLNLKDDYILGVVPILGHGGWLQEGVGIVLAGGRGGIDFSSGGDKV